METNQPLTPTTKSPQYHSFCLSMKTLQKKKQSMPILHCLENIKLVLLEPWEGNIFFLNYRRLPLPAVKVETN